MVCNEHVARHREVEAEKYICMHGVLCFATDAFVFLMGMHLCIAVRSLIVTKPSGARAYLKLTHHALVHSLCV